MTPSPASTAPRRPIVLGPVKTSSQSRPAALQRLHREPVINAKIAIGHQRHRPVAIDAGCGAVHPDDLLRTAVAGVVRRRHRQPDQQIDIAAAQLARQRIEEIGAHDEAHVRPARAELRQDAGQDRGDIFARRADADHQFGARAVVADVHDLVVDREQAARVTDHQFALRRQADALDAAVEQVAAEQKLQPLDLRADRRLRHPELGRGLGEAAQVDDGDKRAQQVGWNIGHRPSRLRSTSNHTRANDYDINTA